MDHSPEHFGPENGPENGAIPDAANAVCYHQNCPICGRNLRIRVVLLGRRVYCQHCGGGFFASDTTSVQRQAGEGADRGPAPARVDELLERASIILGRQGE